MAVFLFSFTPLSGAQGSPAGETGGAGRLANSISSGFKCARGFEEEKRRTYFSTKQVGGSGADVDPLTTLERASASLLRVWIFGGDHHGTTN